MVIAQSFNLIHVLSVHIDLECQKPTDLLQSLATPLFLFLKYSDSHACGGVVSFRGSNDCFTFSQPCTSRHFQNSTCERLPSLGASQT
jgi:hypothetical protein